MLNKCYYCIKILLLVILCTINPSFQNISKPSKEQWIKGRTPSEKLNLISWLIDGCFVQDFEGPNACNFNKIKESAKVHHPPEFQSFDGFYNNLLKVDLGAVDTPLLRKVPPVYSDGVYLPIREEKGKRINPFKISDALMKRTPECGLDQQEACGSKTGKSAFLVYFGQQVVEEILDAQRAGCPPEYFNIKIPKGHKFNNGSKGKSEMPFLRSRYDQNTGQSPGNPRQQLNEITPWIDGGLIYGTSKAWADVLRTDKNGHIVPNGLLASNDEEGLFPVINKIRLPLANPPPPANHSQFVKNHQTLPVDRFFVLGNPRGNENAFLLSFGVVLFRWHNQIASYLAKTRNTVWSGERIFQETRKWVIATHQHITVYNWLEEWLGEPLEEYKGYNAALDPQIEQFFQTAAMRFGHTLVTPGAYMRNYACGGCEPMSFYGIKAHMKNRHLTKNNAKFKSTDSVRTCNIFWRPQEPLLMPFEHSCTGGGDKRKISDIDPLLMGMASQRAEREDNMIVEDLRGNVFGTLEFSRRDLMAVNIQRGRDHGTPDYNSARAAFGLTTIKSVKNYLSETGSVTPERIVVEMEKMHTPENGSCTAWKSLCKKSVETAELKMSDEMRFKCSSLEAQCNELKMKAWDNIDVWTGGILETSDRPGPLFRAIIKDQFTRIRDADRFWFENTNWKEPRFSKEQLSRIKSLDIFDMVVSVTRMKEEDIQSNPFRVPIKGELRDSKFLTECVEKHTGNYWKLSGCWKQHYDVKSQPIAQNFSSECYHFPQLDSVHTKVEECVEIGHYDYFSGSEVSYIATYVSLILIVLGIFSLVPLLAKLRERGKQANLNKIEKERQKSKNFEVSGKKETTFSAREWIGYKDGTRGVGVLINDKFCLEIYSHKGELLRSIDLSTKDKIDLVLVNDGLHLVIKNPNEYDCVLQFDGQMIRNSFQNNLLEKLGGIIEVNETHSNLKQALSGATTKHCRLARLENFFRVVFAQAFSIDKPSGKSNLLDPKIIREVINTELTRAEFADSMGMSSTSQFVEKMFDLVDRDRNGYISFREFLDMLVVFAKGSAEEKAQLMFEMYDFDRSGKLSVDEFKTMIRSMLDAANADIKNEDVDELFNSILSSAGLNRDSEVGLEDFQKILGKYKDNLGYAQLNFKGPNVPETSMMSVRESSHHAARAAIMSIYGGLDEQMKEEKGDKNEFLDGKDASILTHVNKRSSISTWFELYRLKIFWTLLFTLLLFSIFAERAYYYSVEREHGGLRHIAGYGVTVTRGAASAMMFCYATLLLTMCRNTITQLRETFLHRFIPFDSCITFHKYVAYMGGLFTIVHVVGHAINFYHISTQTASDLSCLFPDYFRATHILPKFHYWSFQTITGITGILLVIHAALIYIFATNYARAKTFRMFWITHNTYPIWYLLMILHGSGRLVQEPIFHFFLLGPLALFILDHLITTSRKKIEIPVLRAELLPSNVTKLEFARPTGFEYKSGQWIRIACLSLNSNEYHPFTISSAPHEPSLTLHIRAVGPFTANIRQIYESSLPKLYIDGPYGEGHQDWWRYEVSVLIGGGIGVTPFASILKDVAANSNPRNCKKIYFLWVTRTQKQFEWFVDIIREVEKHKIISVHIFVTEIYDKFDMRTVFLYICERHFQKVNNKSLFTGLRAVSHFGRPNFLSFLKSLRTIHPNVAKFGVFSCGPLPMTKKVDEACSLSNNDIDNKKSVIFQHHCENF